MRNLKNTFKSSLILIVLIFICRITYSQSPQKINYKKEIAPYISERNYSETGIRTAINYLKQNTKSNGELTDKALLMSYNNIYYTRLYLGESFYQIGITKMELHKLDSSKIFFEDANKMEVEFSKTQALEGISKVKAAIEKTSQKIKEEKDKEVANEKYKINSATATFLNALKTDNYCLIQFKTSYGEELSFIDPTLGNYKTFDNSGHIELCDINPLLKNDTFNITYKLGEVRTNKGQRIKTEGLILLSIEMTDKEKEKQTLKQALSNCIIELNSLINELQKYSKYEKEINNLQTKVNETAKIEDCGKLKFKLSEKIKEYKKIDEDIKSLETNQKIIKASISCSTCPEKVAKQFLDGCVKVDGVKIRSTLTNCSITGEDCEEMKLLQTPMNNFEFKFFNYGKYMKDPQTSQIQELYVKEKYYTYFQSKNNAIVVAPPKAFESNVAFAIFLVERRGEWKVIGFCKTTDDAVIKNAFNIKN